MLPAVIICTLLLAVFVCGARAVVVDLRARRWIWALAGTVATVTGTGALLLVVTHASLTAPLGL
jgi:hypothetical protein